MAEDEDGGRTILTQLAWMHRDLRYLLDGQARIEAAMGTLRGGNDDAYEVPTVPSARPVDAMLTPERARETSPRFSDGLLHGMAALPTVFQDTPPDGTKRRSSLAQRRGKVVHVEEGRSASRMSQTRSNMSANGTQEMMRVSAASERSSVQFTVESCDGGTFRNCASGSNGLVRFATASKDVSPTDLKRAQRVSEAAADDLDEPPQEPSRASLSSLNSSSSCAEELAPRRYDSRPGPMSEYGRDFRYSPKIMSHRSTRSSGKGQFTWRYLPMHPTCTGRVWFDIMSILLILYDSLYVPYSLAWNVKTEGIVLIMGLTTTIFWFIDLILGFITGYRIGEDLVMDLGQIFWHYLFGWFPVDVFCTVCDVAWLIMAIVADGSSGGAESVYVRMARFAKASRAVRVLAKFRMGLFRRVDDFVRHYAGKIGMAEHVSFLTVAIKLVVIILWLNHVSSCLWYTVGKWPISDTGYSWERALLEEDALYDSSDRYMYLTGMYWAISTMFSGSAYMAPSNTVEAIFTQAYIVISALFVSSLTSCLAAILVQKQMQGQEMSTKLHTLVKFLNQHRVGPLLAIAVREQAQRQMMAEKRLCAEDVRETTRLLSRNLQIDLRVNLYMTYVCKSYFFRTCDILENTATLQLCFNAVDRTYVPGEEVFVEGDDTSKGHICIYGSLNYVQAIGRVENVGPGNWICEQAFWIYWKCQGTLETLAACELLSISQEVFEKAVFLYPELLRFVRMYSKSICEAVKNEELDNLNDLRSVVDPDAIMTTMPHDIRKEVSKHVFSLTTWNRNLFSIFEQARKGEAALEKEIEEGKCFLTFVEQGTQTVCLRVVHLVVLRLMNASALLCVRVAKWKDGVVKPAVALPGEKVKKNEDPRDTLGRLYSEELNNVGPGLSVDGNEIIVERSTSANYGMDTKYIRRVYYGSMVAPTDDLGPFSPAFARRSARQSYRYSVGSEATVGNRFTGHRVRSEAWKAFAIRLKDNVAIYAWMQDDDFTYLSEHDNNAPIISDWLRDLNEAQVEQLLGLETPDEGITLSDLRTRQGWLSRDGFRVSDVHVNSMTSMPSMRSMRG